VLIVSAFVSLVIGMYEVRLGTLPGHGIGVRNHNVLISRHSRSTGLED
jgi:hypothetical protein